MLSKPMLVLASLAAAGALLASGDTTATARDRATGREAKLERRVDQLEQRTRRLTSRARRYGARAVAAESALTGRTRERDTLSQQLATAIGERDKAASERDAALSQLSAIPTPFERAVEHIRREVDYTEWALASANLTTMSRDALIAHAAMQYVVGHVSAPAYGYRNQFGGGLPQSTASSVLDTGAGICGHAALTFAALVQRFALPVRSVQFYYPDGINNHIAAEVFYDGAWHYFDPTWGAYYRDGNEILSISAARARPDAETLLEYDTTLFWHRVASLGGSEPVGAETDPSTRVEIDKQPFTATAAH
jgi:Transglutaminase-like superfamily